MTYAISQSTMNGQSHSWLCKPTNTQSVVYCVQPHNDNSSNSLSFDLPLHPFGFEIPRPKGWHFKRFTWSSYEILKRGQQPPPLATMLLLIFLSVTCMSHKLNCPEAVWFLFMMIEKVEADVMSNANKFCLMSWWVAFTWASIFISPDHISRRSIKIEASFVNSWFYLKNKDLGHCKFKLCSGSLNQPKINVLQLAWYV